MKNNFWEEKNMMPDVNTLHEEVLQKINIPEWANVKCPYCEEEMPLKSVRSFGICLNTRNLGDLFVEVQCDKCQVLDTVYFRKEITDIKDFIGFLNGESQPKSEPILEKDMYKLQYNNLLDEHNKVEK